MRARIAETIELNEGSNSHHKEKWPGNYFIGSFPVLPKLSLSLAQKRLFGD
jgi:hypothetical protein